MHFPLCRDIFERIDQDTGMFVVRGYDSNGPYSALEMGAVGIVFKLRIPNKKKPVVKDGMERSDATRNAMPERRDLMTDAEGSHVTDEKYGKGWKKMLQHRTEFLRRRGVCYGEGPPKDEVLSYNRPAWIFFNSSELTFIDFSLLVQSLRLG